MVQRKIEVWNHKTVSVLAVCVALVVADLFAIQFGVMPSRIGSAIALGVMILSSIILARSFRQNTR